jgi:hypothetical protein
MTQAHPQQRQQPPKKQPRWWVWVLVMFGVLLFLGAIFVGAIVWWVSANKDRLLAEGKQTMAEAEAYAADHDQRACVDEGLRRLDVCDGLVCESKAKVFVSTCIKKAQATAGFCEGVPAKSQIIDTSLWVIDECVRQGRQSDDSSCHRFMQALPEACHP